MLHLATQINKGIHKKEQAKEDDNAKKWRKIYSTLSPIKLLVQMAYVLQTQFEQPYWCLKIGQ